MSTLLHDVLRTQSQQLPADGLTDRLNSIKLTSPNGVESTTTAPSEEIPVRTPSPTSEEDELIAVQSVAGTPRAVSRGSSRPNSRPQSPTRIGAVNRRPPGPLLLSSPDKKAASRDPLKTLPTDISQRIFGRLTIKQLARCARVNKKWNRSQTLNYVWFQHYRKESFHDESLPPGKWTRRESKQNWRTTFLDDRRKRAKEESGLGLQGYYTHSGYSRSGTASYAGSGYQTPREMREEQWKAEAEQTRPGKTEMREMYKELGGRKAKTKAKFQTSTTSRDRGGWTAPEEFA